MIVTDNYYAKQMAFDFNLINIGMSSLGGANTYKFSHRYISSSMEYLTDVLYNNSFPGY